MRRDDIQFPAKHSALRDDVHVLGALVGLWVSGGTVNLFSQIGIVMLVGLAAKNGILIVEFANQLRDDGRTVREAIIESAMVRLRPILMTSIATVVGAIPLVVAGGPGSASRGTIGIVIIFVIAAVITPSADPISLFALAIPMMIFYEISIWIGLVVVRRRASAEVRP